MMGHPPAHDHILWRSGMWVRTKNSAFASPHANIQVLLSIPQTFCCTAGGHDRYKSLRNIFYSDINGVIIVHDHAAGRC